jgi:hypothetical protein
LKNHEFGLKIEEDAMNMQGHETPVTPQFNVVRPIDEDKIPISSQSRCPALEWSYTSLSTQDLIWRIWSINCTWNLQGLQLSKR